MSTDTIWIYSFDDGTEFELLNIGFSTQEIIMLEKLHGKCFFVAHERVRRWRRMSSDSYYLGYDDGYKEGYADAMKELKQLNLT